MRHVFLLNVLLLIKDAVPLETAALNRRSRSYAIYLFLVFCSMYAYFVVAVLNRHQQTALINQVSRKRSKLFSIFKNIFIFYFVSYLKEKTCCNFFFNVACTPCTKYEFILAIQYYFWISIFRYEANYWFVFIWFFNPAPPPQLWACNLFVGKIPGGGGSN